MRKELVRLGTCEVGAGEVRASEEGASEAKYS
jgi:hypothetical protein